MIRDNNSNKSLSIFLSSSVKTRANFNHFVLMESTRSVFKQLVQSGYIHFFGLFVVFIIIDSHPYRNNRPTEWNEARTHMHILHTLNG